MNDPNELFLTKKGEIDSNLRMARVCINTYFLAMEEYAETKSASDLKDAAELLRKAADWLDKINTTGEKD